MSGYSFSLVVKGLTRLVAGGSKGVNGFAVAALTSLPADNVPCIGGTAVAVLADHVGLAGTLATVLIALALIRGRTGLRYGSHCVTHALCTGERYITRFSTH